MANVLVTGGAGFIGSHIVEALVRRGDRVRVVDDLSTGNRYVVPEDVRALAPDVLRHRVVLTFEAEAEDLTTDDVVAKVLGAVRVP